MEVAVVTGGASGLGEAVVKKLQKETALLVIVVDIKKPKDNLDLYFNCDLTNKQNLEQTFHDIIKKFQTIDILINNAGIISKRPFLETSEFIELSKVIELNLEAVIHCSLIASKQMMKQTSRSSSSSNRGLRGRIINIASMAGLGPLALDPVYSASKYGVVGFSSSLSYYLRRNGIRVYAVCPHFFETDLVKNTGYKIKEFISIDDVVEAVWSCINDDIQQKGMYSNCVTITPREGIKQSRL